MATNRCITINTMLTQRFLAQVNESATRLNWIVITLAAASVLASIASIVVSVWLAHRACC